MDNLYDAVSVNYVHQLTKALEAKELYQRDKDYLVADGEVKIVDEFTGRTLDGRRWSDGLHQAVEAKERVSIKEENHTWATVTLQNYFRMYEKLSGMTGTAETEAAEFAGTYGLPVVPIPTNKHDGPGGPARPVFKSEEAKFNAVVEDIAERHEPASRSWSARPRWPSPSSCPACWRSRASPRGAERQAALPGGRDRGPGRPARRRHRRHQHGRPRRRHHPRRQPRGAGPARAAGRGLDLDTDEGAGATSSAARPRSRRAAGPRARRSASSAASTCWAASATRAGASTTSCGAAPAARATRARAASSSRSRTS